MSEGRDSKLIVELMQNCESALQTIYEKYSQRVYNFVFLILKDTGWSEDVVQEVFVKLWNNRQKLQPEGSLWAYLSILSKRLSLNKIRDLKIKGDEFNQLWDNITHLSDCSHEKLIAKELFSKLDEVLNELPDRQREVFSLSRFDGFTHQEIAKQLNISPNTVKNHMIQALKVVRNATYYTDLLICCISLVFIVN